ncbi:unnamed protein product [Mycena citricolor]|uniref:Yeast cell wall synthesis Kre9/Knh1-like N-terminal domain-containing protein n=1 Tax=Mycena citricolor TaxID=2018698 RepID=A0AAD2K0U7_9AGAR|nr:unnamed protein product [Mycena citricolor]
MHAAATITTLLSLFASTYAVSNLQGPTNAAPGSNVTATWSSGSSDTQTMTLALLSADTNVTYPGGLAVANTVVPGDNKATFLFPPTDPGTYKLVLYSSSNTSDVLATSGSFSVGAAAPASTASGSTAPPASSASSKPATSSGCVLLPSVHLGAFGWGGFICTLTRNAAPPPRIHLSTAPCSIAAPSLVLTLFAGP